MSNKVKKERMIAKLTERYGPDSVRIHSEYHIQIAAKPTGWHDIWFNQWGEKKFKMAGKRTVYPNMSSDNVMRLLADHVASRTDLAYMQTAKDIGSQIHRVAEIVSAEHLTEAFYVDAGYKDGHCKLSVVHAADSGNSIDAKVRLVKSPSINDGEYRAVTIADEMRIDDSIPIFTDSKGVAAKHPAKNVKWISRKKNKAADKLGNMRGKNA